MGQEARSVATTEYRKSHAPTKDELEWRLVERYVEDFRTDDYRLVFKRGCEVVELSVSREQFKALDGKPKPVVA